MSDRIEADHEAHPNRIFFTSASYSSKAYDYWKSVTDKIYVIGDFVWTAMDYIGEVSAGEAFYAPKADANTGAQDVLDHGKLPDGVTPDMLYDLQFDYMPNLFPKYVSWWRFGHYGSKEATGLLPQCAVGCYSCGNVGA